MFLRLRHDWDGLWHLLIRTGWIESVSAGLPNAAFALTGNLSAPPRRHDVSNRPTCDPPLSPGDKRQTCGGGRRHRALAPATPGVSWRGCSRYPWAMPNCVAADISFRPILTNVIRMTNSDRAVIE